MIILLLALGVYFSVPAAMPVTHNASEIIAPAKSEIASKLTPLQFNVTQQDGTEPAFNNEYWDNHREGIYVDIVDGTPLFSSKDKYDS